MKYHIWTDEETRITVDDENERTDGRCVTLVDGQILSDDDEVDGEEDERLDVEAMDAAMAETVARYDLSNPDARAYLLDTFGQTREHARAKVEDHGAMLKLSQKYIDVVMEAEVQQNGGGYGRSRGDVN
jgi:hypothetical protein